MADEFDPDAYLSTFNPDEYLAQPAQKPAAGDDASWWSGAATAIPSQMAKAAGTTAEVLARGFGPEARSKQGAVESLLNTGAAIAEIPTAPIRQAAALVTPALGAVSHQIGKWINPKVAATDVPQETYDRLAPGVETALGATKPGRVSLPAAPRPTANGPLGVVLSEGEMTGSLPLRKKEQAALRDQSNPAAHTHAKEFAEQRVQQIDAAQDKIARDMDPLGLRVADTPQEAGEMVSQALRANAKAAKTGVDTAYETARALPGEVHAAAFEGIAPKIKWELSNRPEPIIIDELTPRASKALDYISERVANLDIPNKADPFGQPNPENIVGVSLNGIDQWRKNLVAMRKDAYSSGNAPDGRAISAVLKEFDNAVDGAINGGLFRGDPRAVDAWNAARAAHSEYRSMFKKGKNDPVGGKIEKIIGNETNAPAIGSEVAAFIGGDGGKITTEKLGVARRLREVLGETSMEWSAIRQGQWDALKEGTPLRSADRIEKFLGTPMAPLMYEQGSRAAMQSYADLMRQITVPQASGQWSNNAPFMQRIRSVAEWGLGAMIGHAAGAAAGIPFGGEAIGAVATMVRQGRAASREAKQIEKQMPILADQVKKWQDAQARALKRQTPGTVKSLSSAYNAVDRSLRHMETIGQRLQSPVASSADTDEQKIPGPPAQENSGGEEGGQKGFAHGGRVVPSNINHSPTDGQKQAGNYAKDHVRIQGLDITVENAKGKYRRGVDKDGKPWAVRMPAHYGYIKGTEGSDEDHVDVYVGPAPNAPKVFVVDQKDADTGKFDEHKAFVGFASKAQVIAIYRKCFNDGKADKRLGHIAEMSPEQFRTWLDDGDTTKPVKQMWTGGRVQDEAPDLSWVSDGGLSPHEAAALRVRSAAKPEGGREEGLATRGLDAVGRIPMSMVGAGAGMVDAARDIAAEQTGQAPVLSTDYEPRRVGAGLAAETGMNLVGTPAITGGVPISALGSGARRTSRYGMIENQDVLKQLALDARNEGRGSTVKVYKDSAAQQRARGGDPAEGTWGRAVAENTASWRSSRDDAVEDYRRAVYPERYVTAEPQGTPLQQLFNRSDADYFSNFTDRKTGTGVVAANNADEGGIRAYHGSPHDFDKFDLSKIGTGEGAQSYGHGLYFAENEGVAKSYREALALRHKGMTIEGVSGKRLNDLTGAERQAYAMLANDRGDIDRSIQRSASAMNADEVMAVLTRWKADGRFEFPKGKMYEVNINAKPEQFLNYDAPLPANSPVRDILDERANRVLRETDYGGLRNEAKDTILGLRSGVMTGEGAYDRLAMLSANVRPAPGGRFIEPNKVAATEAFREAGIPGIKYLDQGSRGIPQVWTLRHPQGGLSDYPTEQMALAALAKNPEMTLVPPKPQSSNYVVFDDKLIDILRKYGIALPGGGIAIDYARMNAEQENAN